LFNTYTRKVYFKSNIIKTTLPIFSIKRWLKKASYKAMLAGFGRVLFK